MADLNSVLASNQTQTDLLVESYKQTQQTRINTLNQQKTLLQSRQSFYNTLNSRMNNLVNILDKFNDSTAVSKFFSKTITSSDKSVVSATATSTATIGDNTIKVGRLASNDLLITKRLTLTDSFGESAGEKTFDISIGDTTKQVKVTFDGTETNEQAMKKIVQSLNSTEGLNLNSSYVKDTSTTGRISITSKNTGSENRITFVQNDLLDKLGLNPDDLLADTNTRVLSTDTQAGFRTQDFAALDSVFELNGIDITRSSNSIDDALDGITINLLKAQKDDDSSVKLATTADSASVEDFVKSLLTGLNDIFSNINSNKDVKRNDSAVSGLVQKLKNITTSKLGDGTLDAPQYLSDLGIKFDSNGFLNIADSSKFQKALESNPQKIADLFLGENGMVAQIEDVINPFKGTSGLFKDRSSSLKSQIDTATKRITVAEERVELQAAALKKQYQSYLQLFYNAQNQSSYLSGFSETSFS
jgi:flagellar hook-associated protein 2